MNDNVLAVFSMAQVCFNGRGLNEKEKKLVIDSFNSLDEEDFDTRTYIVNMHTDLFNSVMKPRKTRKVWCKAILDGKEETKLFILPKVEIEKQFEDEEKQKEVEYLALLQQVENHLKELEYQTIDIKELY